LRGGQFGGVKSGAMTDAHLEKAVKIERCRVKNDELDGTKDGYCIGDKSKPLPESEGLMVLRLGMAFIGRVEEGDVPGNTRGFTLPSFTVIAKDREAAKAYMCEKLDDLLDVVEEDEKGSEK
jgi:hypothetical protein